MNHNDNNSRVPVGITAIAFFVTGLIAGVTLASWGGARTEPPREMIHTIRFDVKPKPAPVPTPVIVVPHEKRDPL